MKLEKGDTVSVISAFDDGERIVGIVVGFEDDKDCFHAKTVHGKHMYRVCESKPIKLEQAKPLLGYIADDSFETLHLTDPNRSPRSQLLEQMDAKSCKKVYVDVDKGEAKHIGYIVNTRWFTIYEVREWSQPA